MGSRDRGSWNHEWTRINTNEKEGGDRRNLAAKEHREHKEVF